MEKTARVKTDRAWIGLGRFLRTIQPKKKERGKKGKASQGGREVGSFLGRAFSWRWSAFVDTTQRDNTEPHVGNNYTIRQR